MPDAPQTLTSIAGETDKALQEAASVLMAVHARLTGPTVEPASSPREYADSVLGRACDTRDMARRLADLAHSIANAI